MRSRGTWAFAAAACLFPVMGCILDENRCGPHQVENPGELAICVCKPNAAMNPDDGSCTPCGKNEVVHGALCVCKAGFARLSETDSCEMSIVGAACSDDQGCAEPYPYCATGSDGAGYCTVENCESNADCPNGLTCESDGTSRFCRKLPTGIGVPCKTSAECASYEATYCEPLEAKSCLVEKCATGEATCPNDWTCCSWASFSLSLCLPAEGLVDGACPAGGAPVTP